MTEDQQPPHPDPLPKGEGSVWEEGRWAAWLLVAAVALVAAGALLPLTDGDTALYATVARDALKSGNWVTFHFRDGRVFDKPPLTTWLFELSIAVFGSTEWAVRMWHVGLALATVLATYHLARLALSARQSLVAALILLTSGQFFYQSLVPQQDIPLTLFVTLAAYWYLRWTRAALPWTAALAGVSTSLAVLSKGLLGAVLPVVIVAVHLVLDRPKWPRTWLRDAAVAVVAFLAVAAPWFVAAGLRQGRAFVDTFLLGGTLGIGRFFHPVLSSPGAPPAWTGLLAYLIFLLLGVLPWTGWLWPGLREGWKARGTAPVLRICAVWVVAVLVFLTVSPGDKVIRFLLPAFPAAAVLVGYAAGDDRWTRTASRISLLLGGVLLAALAWIVRQPLPADAAPYVPMVQGFLLPLAAGLVGAAWFGWRGRRQQALTFLTALTLVAYGMLVIATVRQWDRISPWRPIARMINAVSPSDVRVLVLGERTPFAEFYIERPVEFADRARLRDAWKAGRVVAVVPVDALASLAPGPMPIIAGYAPGRLLIIRNF